MPAVVLIAGALILAWIFASAAVHKWRDPRGFEAVLENYRLLPPALNRYASRILPWLEAAAALGLLVPGASRAGAVLAGGLLCVYAGAMGINLVRGRRDFDCGCGGGGRDRLSVWLLLRNLCLAVLAGMVALTTSDIVTPWYTWVVGVCAAAAACLAYAVWNQLLLNRRLSGSTGSAHV